MASACFAKPSMCAPYLAQKESVVAGVGAQRTARPILWFMESPLFLTDLLTGHEPKLRKSLEINEPFSGSWEASTSKDCTRIGAMNLVGTRSTASPWLSETSGT